MPAVRYVALAALVVWMGLTIAAVSGDLAGDLERQFPAIAAACGAVVFFGLFVMKFVGPPPRAFPVRAAIAGVMLAAAAYAWLTQAASAPLVAVNGVLGFLLLFWYSNE